MHYPCNYGYIPHTLSDDGDPVDVLVSRPFALMPGVVVRCRPIGMLKMSDEAGGDTKLLAVPIDKLTPLYRAIETPRDLPGMMLEQITHFFGHYKDLEAGQVGEDRRLGRPGGGQGRDHAQREALQAAAPQGVGRPGVLSNGVVPRACAAAWRC